MLSPQTKKSLRHVALIGLACSFPILYLGAVTLEEQALIIGGLGIAGTSSVIAWIAF